MAPHLPETALARVGKCAGADPLPSHPGLRPETGCQVRGPGPLQRQVTLSPDCWELADGGSQPSLQLSQRLSPGKVGASHLGTAASNGQSGGDGVRRWSRRAIQLQCPMRWAEAGVKTVSQFSASLRQIRLPPLLPLLHPLRG